MRTILRAAQVFGFLAVSILLRSTTSFVNSQHSTATQFQPLEQQDEVVMTENPKYSSPLDAEKYTVAPSQLELEQVHIYVRHGLSNSAK